MKKMTFVASALLATVALVGGCATDNTSAEMNGAEAQKTCAKGSACCAKSAEAKAGCTSAEAKATQCTGEAKAGACTAGGCGSKTEAKN